MSTQPHSSGASASGMSHPQHFDVVIVGAGPAGLSLAQQVKPLGLRVALVEQSSWASLADPAFDGREIALTQHSVGLLQRMGAWAHLPADAISPLRDARVMDGADPFAMVISHLDAPGLQRLGTAGTHSELGFLVGNHHIRKALFDVVQAADGNATVGGAVGADAQASAQADHTQAGETLLFTGQAVLSAHDRADHAEVVLADGRRLTADLLVAADSRHSSIRRAWGVAADMHDFGRSMLVCNMTHDVAHDHAAWEWFDYGQTLALLPMNPCPQTGMYRSSVVLTLPSSEMQQVQSLDETAFNAEIERRFAGRLGSMRQASTRHVYPLVAVYPKRLVAHRLACVGDAACGMHPVTAHGFNLGLRSIEALAAELARCRKQGVSLADSAALARYERNHWLASRPTYLATQLVTRLYTHESPPARLLRQAALRIGQRLTPFRRAVAASLTGA